MDTCTLGRTSLDMGSAPRISLYLLKAKYSQEKISMSPPGFEPHSSKREVTGLRLKYIYAYVFCLTRQRSMFSRFTKLTVKYWNLIPPFLVYFTTLSNYLFGDWKVMSWMWLVRGYDLIGALFRHLIGMSKKTRNNILPAVCNTCSEWICHLYNFLVC
jgi:hypothetical protein